VVVKSESECAPSAGQGPSRNRPNDAERIGPALEFNNVDSANSPLALADKSLVLADALGEFKLAMLTRSRAARVLLFYPKSSGTCPFADQDWHCESPELPRRRVLELFLCHASCFAEILQGAFEGWAWPPTLREKTEFLA